MYLKYLVFALVNLSLLACLPDRNPGQAAAQASNSSTQDNTAKAPQVKVNPDSPAFKGNKSAQSELQYKQKSDEIVAKQKAAQKKRDEKNPFKNQTHSGYTLPSACELVTEAFLGKVIGVDPGYITIKDGSGRTATQRSCFFRWDHEGEANSGVLIQVQSNPLPDEFPEWASYYIAAKKNQGDKSPDGNSTFRYSDFKAIGVSGAYHYELARYYWRDKTDRVFMVAFNLPSSEQEQLAWAETIAKEVMKNAN